MLQSNFINVGKTTLDGENLSEEVIFKMSFEL